MNIPNAASTDLGAISTNEPRAAATPLPPRNFNQTGNMWPSKTNSTAVTVHIANSDDNEACRIGRHGMSGSDMRRKTRGLNIIQSAKAADPLSASTSSVNITRRGDLREKIG